MINPDHRPPVPGAAPGDGDPPTSGRLVDFVTELELADADELGAPEPMDRTDLRLLGELVALYDVADPMPPLLPDLVLFGLDGVGALERPGAAAGPIGGLDLEFARMVTSELATAGPSGTRAVEHARRVTFASESLTIMLVMHPLRDGSVRLDGWAAPGGGLRAELRSGDAVLSTDCDDAGRFVFEAVPGGPAQLVLHPTSVSDPVVSLSVVTPAVHL